ncbi:MAG: Uma2 family endonuclease [Acidobacteria bacterium]|nr:Uma2 family endonuclease [Acidobacteriota bacterium]
MATLPQIRLMTVEEFRRLPSVPGQACELHHGEVFLVTFPMLKHHFMQERLLSILGREIGSKGYLTWELPFRAIPEYDLRSADVGFVESKRSHLLKPDDALQGSPDLVIEVLSPSNSAQEIFERERLCLRNGCKEFWTVDLKRKEIRVTTDAGMVKTYGEDDEIPLTTFGGTVLKVAEVFAS